MFIQVASLKVLDVPIKANDIGALFEPLAVAVLRRFSPRQVFKVLTKSEEQIANRPFGGDVPSRSLWHLLHPHICARQYPVQ